MQEPKDSIRLHRKEAVTMDQLVSSYIKQMKLAAGLNKQRIFDAWDSCSGAGPFTLRRTFKDGKLVITMSSSVYRNQLLFQKEELIRKMNAWLDGDPLFTADNRSTGYIQELILK